jgi:hypothetical protein
MLMRWSIPVRRLGGEPFEQNYVRVAGSTRDSAEKLSSPKSVAAVAAESVQLRPPLQLKSQFFSLLCVKKEHLSPASS